MKRKQNIDQASKSLAVAIRNLDDAMMSSNGMQRTQLLNAKRGIADIRQLLQEALEAP